MPPTHPPASCRSPALAGPGGRAAPPCSASTWTARRRRWARTLRSRAGARCCRSAVTARALGCPGSSASWSISACRPPSSSPASSPRRHPRMVGEIAAARARNRPPRLPPREALRARRGRGGGDPPARHRHPGAADRRAAGRIPGSVVRDESLDGGAPRPARPPLRGERDGRRRARTGTHAASSSSPDSGCSRTGSSSRSAQTRPGASFPRTAPRSSTSGGGSSRPCTTSAAALS